MPTPTPPPNPKLTLTCYQLTIGGGGGCAGTQRPTPTQDMFVIRLYFELKIISIGFCSFMLFFKLIVNCREDKASRLQASKMAIVTIFRSWSGQYPRVDDALNSHFCICDAMISQVFEH